MYDETQLRWLHAKIYSKESNIFVLSKISLQQMITNLNDVKHPISGFFKSYNIHDQVNSHVP